MSVAPTVKQPRKKSKQSNTEPASLRQPRKRAPVAAGEVTAEGSAPPDRRIEYMSLTQIVPALRNAKGHADAEIRASVGRFGYVELMTVDERTGRLVAGHGRLDALKAMQERGEPAPAGVVVHGQHWVAPVLRGWSSRSDAEADAYLLASNRLVEVGGWDNESLVTILKALEENAALVGVGYSSAEIAALAAKMAAPNEFQNVDPDELETEYQCPKCGYEWSGAAKPGTVP